MNLRTFIIIVILFVGMFIAERFTDFYSKNIAPIVSRVEASIPWHLYTPNTQDASGDTTTFMPEIK